MEERVFDARQEMEKITDFIREYFAERPLFRGAAVGISGGKDSLVCAALCARALGASRVLGVMMPNGEQNDIRDALETVRTLGIPSVNVNINWSYKELIKAIGEKMSPVTLRNIPPRLRMTTIYALAQERRLLVCNTGNLSEITIGYTTKWGDNVGDFAPIAHLTKTEVVEVGVVLGLPLALVLKTPSDGLTGVSDEEWFGFSYVELDDYIRNALDSVPAEVAEKIEQRIAVNRHKRLPMSTVQ